MPRGDRFKLLIEARLAEVLKGHQAVSSGDSHRHERLKGQYIGLEEALKLYREAHRPEEDDED